MSPILLLLLLLLLFLLASSNGAVVAFNHTKTTKRVSTLRLARIHRHLEKINKSPVRSIESQDGDIIDCVPRHRQPALDHPLLKNHKIQRVAPERPRFMYERAGPKNYTAAAPARGAWQAWHHAGHCPKGTVPIRRSTVDDVLRAKSLYHYGKKQRKIMPVPTSMTKTAAPRSSEAPDVVSGNGHEHAIAYTGSAQELYGAKATMNVWDPSIGEANEFSLSQIWVLSGSFDGSDLNSIEAGWQSGQPGALWRQQPQVVHLLDE